MQKRPIRQGQQQYEHLVMAVNGRKYVLNVQVFAYPCGFDRTLNFLLMMIHNAAATQVVVVCSKLSR